MIFGQKTKTKFSKLPKITGRRGTRQCNFGNFDFLAENYSENSKNNQISDPDQKF